MKITVKLFATFRDGRQKVQVLDLPKSSTPNEVISKLDILKSTVAILLINGRDGTLDTELVENDTVSIFPPLGGG
jgi:molybdopterin converting factor small subunit